MAKITIKNIGKPSIFIDTCIARDLTDTKRKHSEASVDLLNRAKREGWICKMSVFGLAELVDIEQERLFVNKLLFMENETLDEVISSRRSRNLNKDDLKKCFNYIKQFQENYSYIQTVGLGEQGWNLALTVACNSNLDASDVIHLVSAWQEDCNLLVTNDTFFIKEAKDYILREGIWSDFRVCRPEDYHLELIDMGFEDI